MCQKADMRVYDSYTQSSEEKEMKSRLVAYGRIQKGRPDRCQLVLLDERLCPEGSGGLAALLQRWHKVFRTQVSLVRRRKGAL